MVISGGLVLLGVWLCIRKMIKHSLHTCAASLFRCVVTFFEKLIAHKQNNVLHTSQLGDAWGPFFVLVVVGGGVELP